MSFGRPPSSFSAAAFAPPDRGSFPLDHEGECTAVMKEYLKCMKSARGDNGKCRELSKQYLECRMDKGLMERDDMSNLGFLSKDDPRAAPPTPAKATVVKADTIPAAAAAAQAGDQAEERSRASTARIV